MELLERGIVRMRETWADAPPRPARRPIPLIVGGAGEKRTLRIVAREASEWNTPYLPLGVYCSKTRVLAGYCHEIGRDPLSIRRSMVNAFLIGRSHAELRARAARVAKEVSPFGGTSPDDILDHMRGRWFIGTPGQVAQQMRSYAEAGVSRFMLQHLLIDDSDALQLLAREVVPSLQLQLGAESDQDRAVSA